LEQDGKEELIWFTFKVMLAIQDTGNLSGPEAEARLPNTMTW